MNKILKHPLMVKLLMIVLLFMMGLTIGAATKEDNKSITRLSEEFNEVINEDYLQSDQSIVDLFIYFILHFAFVFALLGHIIGYLFPMPFIVYQIMTGVIIGISVTYVVKFIYVVIKNKKDGKIKTDSHSNKGDK